MSNHEGIPKNERGNERIPSREDVLAQIQKRYEKAEVLRELADADGIYLLEVREPGEKTGEFTDYVYQRKGKFPGGNEAANTVLEKIYFVDDIPCGGDIIAEYDSGTGEWIEA